MGNKNSVHVQMLETLPLAGFAVAFAHEVAGNKEQASRALTRTTTGTALASVVAVPVLMVAPGLHVAAGSVVCASVASQVGMDAAKQTSIVAKSMGED